jgi:hypothetical protein
MTILDALPLKIEPTEAVRNPEVHCDEETKNALARRAFLVGRVPAPESAQCHLGALGPDYPFDPARRFAACALNGICMGAGGEVPTEFAGQPEWVYDAERSMFE